MTKILLVLGSGGHTDQMIALSERLPECDYSYLIGDDDSLSASKITHRGKIYRVNRGRSVTEPYIKILPRMVMLTFRSLQVLWKDRPDVVITCGPAIGIPVAFFQWVRGKKVIFVEDISRIWHKSNTGKILQYFADPVIVQWKPTVTLYKNAKYGGRLL